MKVADATHDINDMKLNNSNQASSKLRELECNYRKNSCSASIGLNKTVYQTPPSPANLQSKSEYISDNEADGDVDTSPA